MGRGRGKRSRRGLTDLVAVDPGIDAGVALFLDGVLSRVELVIEATSRRWSWPGPFGLPVICEVPQKYRGSPVDMQDLISLSFMAGYITSALQPESIRTIFVREWKGQRPKYVDNQYTRKLLNDQERQILDAAEVPKSKEHNVLDAIGIGLWALERR